MNGYAINPLFPGFVELNVLARFLGLDPATVRRRLRAAGRPLYAYPLDRRRRMIHEDDVRAIFVVRRAPERKIATGEA